MSKEWNLISWMLQHVADNHGCLTGDCPHARQTECVDALLEDYMLEIMDEQLCRRAYSREEIIDEAKKYIREEYGGMEDEDRKYLIFGVLVDFLHDRFPPASGEGVSK